MSTPLSIWKDNRATFGGGGLHWSTNKVLGYYAVTLTLSIALSFFTNRPSDNLFNGVLTAV